MGKVKTGARRVYSDKEKEMAFAEWATTGSMRETARKLNIPVKTIHNWLYKAENDEEKCETLKQVRQIKKAEFSNQAWNIIIDSGRYISRQLKFANEQQEELQEVIDFVNEPESRALMTDTERKELLNKLHNIKSPNMRDVTTTLGIIYDKQAHAAGETETTGQGVQVVFNLPRPPAAAHNEPVSADYEVKPLNIEDNDID